MLAGLLESLFGASYRTTIAGVLAIAYILIMNAFRQFDGDPNTVANWLDAVATIFVGAGLLPARDTRDKVTSAELKL